MNSFYHLLFHFLHFNNSYLIACCVREECRLSVGFMVQRGRVIVSQEWFLLTDYTQGASSIPGLDDLDNEISRLLHWWDFGFKWILQFDRKFWDSGRWWLRFTFGRYAWQRSLGPKGRLYVCRNQIPDTSLASGLHTLCNPGAVDVDFTA